MENIHSYSVLRRVFFFKFLAVQFFHFEGKNSIRYSFRRYYSSNFRGKILIVLTPRVDLFLLFFSIPCKRIKVSKERTWSGECCARITYCIT